MKLELTHDPALDVWTLGYPDCRIETLADVREWERQLRGLMEKLENRVYLLVDVSGLALSPSMSAEYGALLKELIPRYTRGLARYGSPSSTVRAAIRVQATINRFVTDIHPDRASAMAALLEIRQLQQGAPLRQQP